ncbi:MAG: AIPR family protein [Clostridia bacterium]|nr:AIPR family protein [Clostridia bacterium]
MKSINELISSYYTEFVGLPGYRPIVRNNQENDAFELVVLKILYGKFLPEFTKANISEFCKYIVAPPDNGIDIFFQHEDGDDCSFDVIQVKNSALDENELRNAILGMQRTIDDYCKNPLTVNSDSCREILSNSNLDKTNRNRCNYYVIHKGNVDDFSGSNDNENIITYKTLEIIYSNTSENVDRDELSIQTSMYYGNLEDNHGAIVCTLNGHDLAQLNNTYYNTEVGRNILFGSNLRESLITKKSKTFLSMSDTITKCPENFWYYNNGITIIAKEISVDPNNTGRVQLKNFSIVNGAQTTSSLGLFLKEAKKNQESDKIECLKKVFVLTRILKISDDGMREDIAIYNNTQNPITSRDMVANRNEQKHLNEWLLDDTYPQIYCEIRRGSQVPGNFNKGITHRKITNEALAQLVYAYFLQKPFTAKDKKSALFNKDFDPQNEYTINKIYHDIFHWDNENPTNNGVVFQKTKIEIDEALFVQQLYKEAKKHMRNTFLDRINKAKEQREKTTNTDDIKHIDARIAQNSLHMDTAGICMFYFLALYYEFKANFDAQGDTRVFNFDKYYQDKDFKKKMIESTSNLFLALTVKVIVKTANEANKAANVNNWVRSQACEAKFFEALREEMASDFDLEQKYKSYINDFKI